ncbi:SDR family oxidoreductase [Streptomyces sp. DT2A-34]|uniref:SDR family NAD(P)-dependent oxidoreductase n=1 Tax=Streptomyces sp. DT2A-34 TaxID=3051182 RepID=UPI00265C0ECA|nr:glucose 1-dehydrogenase [Streptomyces sp. DT2A-34]MDO0916722.1 SDR family oxidoreductase [Streptomyces sp. DT2A-34]
MGKLDGKTAVITGGSSGIGLETAKKFVAEGAYVYITGRREEELAKAEAEIGDNVATVRGDIADLDDLDRLWARVKEERGSVDIIFSNAGIAEAATLPQATPEHFDKVFSINARGTFFTVQKALPLLNDGGSIVLMSGVGHRLGWPDFTAYSASKAAVRSYARSWAAELKGRGIRVNSVSPGPVETPILDGLYAGQTAADGEAVRAGLAGTVPMGRLAEPEEIAKAVLFLASDDNSYMTGADLPVDGGSTQL